MDGIYKNIEEYNQNKKRKILIVFDGMISDIVSNKKPNPIVTELFIRGKKLNVSQVFITQSYFVVPKNIRLNSTNYFVMKVPKKREPQQIAFNHSLLTFKTLLIFIKNVLQNQISFQLLILLLDQIILHFSEEIFQKEYKY